MIRHLICLPDGTALFSGADQVNAVQSVTLTTCVNSGEELTLGSACAAMMEATLITPGGGLTLTAGEEVTLYQVDEAGQRRKAGVFILERPTRPSANTMKLVGYDRLTRLDKDLTGWLAALQGWPYSLRDFADLVCHACGLTLVTEQIPNGDFQVRPFSAEVTGRQLMQWIGEACCRFCRANADGNIELAWYTPAGISVTPSGERYYFQKGLSYEDYQVARIDSVQLRLGDSEDGALWPGGEENENSYVITGNPLLCLHISNELLPVLQTIQGELPTERYTPCKVCMPVCPGVEAGNTVQITDSNGVNFTAYVMTKTSNGQKDTLECTGSARRDSTTALNNKTPAEKVRQIEIALRSVDGNKVVSLINLSEAGIRIKGDKIQLEGVVTANKNFQILEDGSAVMKNADISGKVTASKGTIAGWNLDDNSLYTTYGDVASRVFLCTGTTKPYTIGGYKDHWYIGAGSSDGSGFGVSTAGVLCASGAKISGEVNARSGMVGGWEIKNGQLYKEGAWISEDGAFQFLADQNPNVCVEFMPDAQGNAALRLGTRTPLQIGDTMLTEDSLKQLLALIGVNAAAQVNEETGEETTV